MSVPIATMVEKALGGDRMANAVTVKAGTHREAIQKWELKILLLSWEYPPNVVGGLSRHVIGLAVQLAKQGHEVHVMTARNEDLPSYERADGVHVHRVRPINDQDENFLSWIGGLNLSMAFKGEQLAEEIHFDLIHAHDWLVGSAAIVLKEVLGLPLLTTIHATEHGRNNGIYTDIQKFIHEREEMLIAASEQLIVCSDYMKESLLTVFHAEESKITVIPNGIDPPATKGPVHKVYPEITNRSYIFSIGRIVQEKGFETIIEAAKLAKELQHDYFFIIAGKGPILEKYQRQVEESNLSKHIVFIGYITDEERNELIQGSEMVVVPSLYEPFGIAVLEAMIQKKPVIVSNTGGMRGIVKHLQTGLVMNPGDAMSLLEQVAILRNHPKLADEIGLKGSQAARSLYSWRRIALDTSRVMEDMIISIRANSNGIIQ